MPRNLTKILLTMGFLVCVLPTFSEAKEKRVALILGNGVYAYPNALKNPAADAYELERALKQLGFEVISGINIDKRQTEKLIENFGKRLAKTRGVGFFYYSGIGFQSNGENFLVPVDASFDGAEQLVKSSVPLSSVLAKLKAAKNKSNIVLLDATRKPASPTIAPVSDSTKIGFAKLAAPPGTLVFYSSENGKPSSESCGRNGLFIASFLGQLENPILEFSQLTEKVAAEVVQMTGGRQKPFTEGALKKPFYPVSKKFRYKATQTSTLENLFECFKLARKLACGQRAEAVAAGKEIIDKYSDDKDNGEVLKYVKLETEKIEKEDPECRLNDAYNAAYKAKDWAKFTSLSKEIIAREGDSPLALDVMLTLVSVGYDEAVAKNDRYNADTIDYAKQAIRRIEAGGTSKTGKWGVYAPFQTKAFPDGKTNALNVLNYIIGWISYYRLGASDPGKKKEGLGYLYRSFQYNGEFKNDFTIFTNLGDYYFAEAARLDKEYRDIRAANENMETDEAKAKRALSMGYADRGIDAFVRAYKLALQIKSSPRTLEAVRKILLDLYRFRFNIPPGRETPDADRYFEELFSRPMPNPETTIEPVLR